MTNPVPSTYTPPLPDDASLTIVQLYPRDMNIYGDWGNVLTVKRRLEWRGIQAEIINCNQEDEIPEDVDILIGGGGQDAGQDKVKDSLLTHQDSLKALAEKDTPMLVVCGLYQLFGHHFTTNDQRKIEGIGLLDVTTEAGDKRLIGNIVTSSEDFGTIIGYENHSGLTHLGPSAQPLARVVSGQGNNDNDNWEGARYKNVLGTYLHGSLLPKNPHIADFLISQALKNKYNLEEVNLPPLDDGITEKAREVAQERPR